MKQIYASARLSKRETDVLRLLGDGKTTSETAVQLKIGLKTAQAYCARLKRKLHAANLSRLIRVAVLWRAGVIDIVVKAIRLRRR